MRKLVHAAAAAVLMLSAAGCQNALGDADGPLTGTWKVTITDFQRWATQPHITCDTETTYVMRQEGREIEGRSEISLATCTNSQNGTTTTSQKGGGVVRGPVENGRIDVSDAGDWHCIAELHPTRIEGYLESYGGVYGEPMQTVRSGTCVLEKISDAGYDGPRA
jgi:hypothetical protein